MTRLDDADARPATPTIPDAAGDSESARDLGARLDTASPSDSDRDRTPTADSLLAADAGTIADKDAWPVTDSAFASDPRLAPDAAAPPDARQTPDAGTPPPDTRLAPDAAAPPDARLALDAAAPPDARLALDAAAPPDARLAPDAPTPPDARLAPDAACQWTFGSPTTYPVFVGVINPSIVVADLNHDGVLDLTILGDKVTVLLGNVDGTFAPAVVYGAGQGTWTLALADFNGDGNLDVAESNLYNQAQSIDILLGDGQGGFAVPDVYPAPGPSGLAAADFDGDGYPDLVFSATDQPQTVVVMLNRGDGTFGASTTYAADSPSAINTADFNGDGHPDFAVACYATNLVDVFLNRGDGTFLPRVSYGAVYDPEAMTVGDLNGDGRPDIVVTNTNGDSAGVLLNRGDGTFAPEVTYDTGYLKIGDSAYLPSMPYSVTIGDFNGDGHPDIAVGNENDNTIGVFLGAGDGTFAPQVTFPGDHYPASVVAGDFNGDGLADLAFGADLTGNRDYALVVLLSQCQ